MNENIRHLVRLQEIAFEIRDLEERRTRAPQETAELEAAFQQKIEEIGAARLTHESLVDERARLLEEREVATARLDKAQKKLMAVSNQREYSAVLNEIDATKTMIEQIDESVAQRSASIEELAGPAAEADERIAAEKSVTDAAKAKIAADIAQADARLETLLAQREELTSQLPPTEVRRFEHVFRARGGIAMAAIVSGACGACHVRLRPQVIALVRRGEELITCDSCRRFLYVEEPSGDADETDPKPTPPPADAGLGSVPGQTESAG